MSAEQNAPAPREAARVRGVVCPACKADALVVYDSGQLTCSLASCPDPLAVRELFVERPEPVPSPERSEFLQCDSCGAMRSAPASASVSDGGGAFREIRAADLKADMVIHTSGYGPARVHSVHERAKAPGQTVVHFYPADDIRRAWNVVDDEPIRVYAAPSAGNAGREEGERVRQWRWSPASGEPTGWRDWDDQAPTPGSMLVEGMESRWVTLDPAPVCSDDSTENKEAGRG